MVPVNSWCIFASVDTFFTPPYLTVTENDNSVVNPCTEPHAYIYTRNISYLWGISKQRVPVTVCDWNWVLFTHCICFPEAHRTTSIKGKLCEDNAAPQTSHAWCIMWALSQFVRKHQVLLPCSVLQHCIPCTRMQCHAGPSPTGDVVREVSALQLLGTPRNGSIHAVSIGK